MVELRRLLDADSEVRDPKGEIELATMRMADIVRRMHQRLQRGELDDPQAAAAYVFERLEGLSAGDLARLLGVSARTVTAWRQGSAVRQNAVRVALVAQLTADLFGAR